MILKDEDIPEGSPSKVQLFIVHVTAQTIHPVWEKHYRQA